MAERKDNGLLLAARVLPLSVFIGSRFTPEERRRYRRTLTGAASGERHHPEKVGDASSNATQGLGGAAVACGLVTALFMWLAKLFWFVPFVLLSAVAFGVLALSGTLACIYGLRSAADRMSRQIPRRAAIGSPVVRGRGPALRGFRGVGQIEAVISASPRAGRFRAAAHGVRRGGPGVRPLSPRRRC